LSVFENHRKGGCWYLKISDNASLDSGTLAQWSVHILNQPTIATEAKTWGGMKVLFN
jgi:subtilisin-like proprotein convertase family protein